LTGTSKDEISRIIRDHSEKPNFVFCGNLLLGTASRELLKRCINYLKMESNVMGWPILRLASPELFLPAK
jgi:hypothetical protein